MEQKKVLVTGAGGFIGSHLVTELKRQGCWVRGVDIKYPDFSKSDADQFVICDLRNFDNCGWAGNIRHPTTTPLSKKPKQYRYF